MESQLRITAPSLNPQTNNTSPLVSICIPTFNAARWILDCLDSALAQSYQPLEILVVDDASTDNTVELVREKKVERIRLIVNKDNLGLAANWNKSVAMSHGEFIKFLLQDDLLYPSCIEKMMECFISNDRLGLVFSPRDIVMESDPEASITKTWLKNCTTLHTHFDSLGPVNDGRGLFAQCLRKEFRGNWIGEPSSVLVRKECFDRLGSFNEGMYQNCDVEMWLRIIFFYDVGFVAEKLSAFRFHRDSASFANMSSQRHRLDQVRLLEGLLAYEEIRSTFPELKKMRRWEVVRNIVRLIIPLQLRLKINQHFRSD